MLIVIPQYIALQRFDAGRNTVLGFITDIARKRQLASMPTPVRSAAGASELTPDSGLRGVGVVHQPEPQRLIGRQVHPPPGVA